MNTNISPTGSCLALAFSTKYAAALAKAYLGQAGSTLKAGLSGPAINKQLLLEIARLAITADKIPQSGTALLNGAGQHFFDFLHQCGVTLLADAARLAARINAGSKECFTGVDIANSHHHVVIHDKRLDGGFAAFNLAVQVVHIEGIAERLRTELA